MGFIKAFVGAFSGTFADQWKDYLLPPSQISPTVVLCKACAQGQNNGRGSNTKGSENIISNGTKIVVPEGFALITLQDGQITSFISEVGGYEYRSDDPNSKSIFSNDGFFASTFSTSWQRFKYGGQPASQQLAYYINLKEIPNNKFGTQSEIYYDDVYFNAQVGVLTRGTYTLKIVDPILFVKNYVPVQYLNGSNISFDLSDMENDAATQLFNEVVSSLSSAFSIYTNDPSKQNRITKIQADQVGFAQSLSQAVENDYSWKQNRGLEIIKTAILSIEYDQNTKQLLLDIQKADALSGNRGNSFMQQSAARGIEASGKNGNGSAMAFMSLGANAVGSMMNNMNQPHNKVGGIQTSKDDVTLQLREKKALLDEGLISQEDYDAFKKKILNI